MLRPGQRPEYRHKAPSGPRVNEYIRAPQVRVISDDGRQLGLFSVDGALRLAYDEGLDLVEVSPQASPPVCKLMNFGKYKYEQSKKLQQNKKNQVVIHIKEIKLRPTTDDHDLQVKIKHIRRFIERKDKVKVTVVFKRGREMAHTEQGALVLERVVAQVSDVAAIETPSKVEGRNMMLFLAPKGDTHKKA